MRVKSGLVLSLIAILWGCDFLGPLEDCEDGVDNDDNGHVDCADLRCRSEPECALPFPSCGDGDLDPDESCDDANSNNNDGCLDTCVEARCGDGFTQSGVEECDDGNTVSGDGCVGDCSREEVCGDGILDAGEGCDTADEPTAACGSQCTLLMPSCNNGVRDVGEACFIEAPQQFLSEPEGMDVLELALGDLDGDQDLDLAATTRTPEGVVVLLNDGQGRFTLKDSLSVGPAPSALAAADLDGDNDLDIAVAIGGPDLTNQVVVLKNDGQAKLTSAGAFDTSGDDALSMEAGDLDGDGDFDLVVGNEDSDNVSVLMNSGQGSFGAPTLVSTNSPVRDVMLGSADADGDLDIFAVLSFDSSVALAINNGAGVFGAPTFTPSGGDSPQAGDLGDVDGDADLDLVTVHFFSDDAVVMLNSGSGTYAASAAIPLSDFGIPEDVALADIDGDKALDMVATMNGFHVLLNNGSGSFAAPLTFYDFFLTGALAVGDLNGDGANDLAIAEGFIGGELSIYLAYP